jgi:hypothetical protein
MTIQSSIKPALWGAVGGAIAGQKVRFKLVSDARSNKMSADKLGPR